MDWGQIGASAVYGAIGGGLGGLLGALLAYPFRNMKSGKTIGIILTVVCVVIGINVAQPLLSPYIGKYIGDSAKARADRVTAEIEAAIAELRKNPFMGAVLERGPHIADQFRVEMRRIIADARTPEEARARAFSVAYTTTSERAIYYLARAQDEDLLAHFTVNVEILRHLAVSDPVFCHTYFYDSAKLISMTLASLQ